MLVHPLFWGVFLISLGLLYRYVSISFLGVYQRWLALPLARPLLTFLCHVGLSLLAAFVMLRSNVLLAFPTLVVVFYGGKAFLKGRYQSHLLALERGLPDILDLLSLCLSAGLSLPFALQRVVPLLVKKNSVWGDELRQILAELQLGMPLEKSFMHLYERIPVVSLYRIARMIGHAQQYGTQLNMVFKQMSQDIRDDYMMMTETRAQKMPVYMSLVLVVFFLPALLLLTLGPILIRLVDSLTAAFS